ncbi:MAG: MBL fold metallo-hydrolase [Sphingobium sp.]|nr:MBL fold metallo-hydrolase [Sphingobium sp.]
MRRALLAAATLSALQAAPAGSAEKLEADRLDRDDWLVWGSVSAERQPDGNSLVMTGPKGAIVFDTGRHKDHSDTIEAVLKQAGKPLVAIVNSHWHLDHVSGNLRLKAAHPGVAAWSSDAIDGALTGFLKRGAERNRAAISGGKLSPAELEEARAAVATFEAGDGLKPDHVVRESGPVTLAGRKFDLHLAHNAATEGDVWLYDAAHKRAIVGDLVTFPAPFLDTACPEGWKAALAEVEATPFTSLVPGHGPVMDRIAFARWRKAFTAFVDCGEGGGPIEACAEGWTAYAGSVRLEGTGVYTGAIPAYADYYARLLRGGTLKANCAKGAAA